MSRQTSVKHSSVVIHINKPSIKIFFPQEKLINGLWKIFVNILTLIKL